VETHVEVTDTRTIVKSTTKTKSKKLKSAITIGLFVAPALIVYTLYVLYPIFTTFIYSFYDWDGMGVGTYVGLQNYLDLLKDAIFWKSLTNNTWVVLTSVFAQIPLGLIMALMLFAPIKGIKFFSSIYGY
jgi:raffinose/stachyose/melibiose transport system permease protein